MELLNNIQIDCNLRRTAERGYISLLHKQQLEELALKYFGIKDSNDKYIGYMCPYSGKFYSKKSNLILEHIIPVDSKGGTVLFNCIPTSKEVNGRSEKGSKHLIGWWTTSKYWDNTAPVRLEKIVNYLLEAYDLVFKEYSIEQLEDSYQEVIEINDELITTKRQNKKRQEQSQSNNIHSYLGFLLDCIKQLEKEDINTNEIKVKLKELEEKNIFKDIEKYTLFQNILKQVIIKFTGNDTKSYLTYSLKFNIKKLMDSIDYSNEQEINNDIYSRLLNIQELLSQNNLVMEEYFNSLKIIENTNLVYKSINSISEEEKQEFLKNVKLSINTKIFEFINLLNTGYIPKSIDKNTKFRNGELINYFWNDNKDKIKEILNNDKKYKEGYEIAKATIKKLEFDKIADFIELLNQGYIPKSIEKEMRFSNGVLINSFWATNKKKIKERLELEEKYKFGYEVAKATIKKLEFDKIADFIELLNQGYIPKYEDNETKFSNGEYINVFWSNHKSAIKGKIETDEKYKEGYEIAKKTIYNIENPFDKISEYIELLNQGYIPKSIEKEMRFSNGELLNYFWSSNQDKIKERLFTEEKYKMRYEIAKTVIKELEFDKIVDFIELLNQGYIPKNKDIENKFSNGEIIKNFWATNKKKIKERLEREDKYKFGYELARKIIYNKENKIDKISEYIELLNSGYIPKSKDMQEKFSNGDLINQFWANHKEKIKERLEEDEYQYGYEVAKQTIYNIENPLDKIAEFIELLNQGYIPNQRDKETKFSNGEYAGHFWDKHKEKIKERLEREDKYNEGYEVAKETLHKLENPLDKISEYIELLNQGYIPNQRDKETKFSNGEYAGHFWNNHKEKIKERLELEEKYKFGYEVAKATIKKLEFDKIADFIELLNQGYIPKYEDNETKFSNGEYINVFWSNHKSAIKGKIETDEKYKEGYEIAKKTIYNIENPFDKISEYIELLNQGYIPKYKDMEEKFSNGEFINQFWANNREKIISMIFQNLKDDISYNKSRQIILNYLKVKTIEEYYELEQKKKQLKELKKMKQNLENVDNSLEISETVSRKRA